MGEQTHPTEARVEEITEAVHDAFPGAPVETDVDGRELRITIMTGDRQSMIDDRKDQLAEILYDADVSISHFDDFLPAGSSMHASAYADTEETIERRDAEAESRAAAEAERRAERALDRGRY